MTDKLSKAERIAIGAAVAAPVRQAVARGSRKVTRVDKAGQPVGTTTAAEVAKAVLARAGIEFSVREGTRPGWVTCADCAMPVAVPATGRPPKYCRVCAKATVVLRYNFAADVVELFDKFVAEESSRRSVELGYQVTVSRSFAFRRMIHKAAHSAGMM